MFIQSNLNARERTWLDLSTDYDFNISYPKGAIKNVVDALNKTSKVLNFTFKD